jgi:hypothetical protein
MSRRCTVAQLDALACWPIIWPDGDQTKKDAGARRREAARWLRNRRLEPAGSAKCPKTRRWVSVWEEEIVSAAAADWRASGVNGPGNWTSGRGRRGGRGTS